MAIIKDGYGHSPAKESAQQKAERKWSNAEISKKYKDELEFNKQLSEHDKIITPKDEDVETVEQQRSKRLKTMKDLKLENKLLREIVRSGRNSISEVTVAGYRASLRSKKRKLLAEKLKRLEAQQEPAI